MRRDLHEQNRLSWNEATRAHNSHKGDQARFLREGGSTLFPEELELLGDVAGRSLVHLSCNAGQDTLSLARFGARVTGVDISDVAIEDARRIAASAEIEATFVRADVYDWLAEAAARGDRYDLAFTSYGALGWLSDVAAWARGVAGVLAPGGRVVIVEFHPTAYLFDEKYRLTYPYTTRGAPITEPTGVSDYVARSGELLVPWGYEAGETAFRNPHPAHGFGWGVGELVTALLEPGLTLEALREWPHSNGCALFERMRELPGRRLVPPEDVPELPLMIGIAARRG